MASIFSRPTPPGGHTRATANLAWIMAVAKMVIHQKVSIFCFLFFHLFFQRAGVPVFFGALADPRA